MPGCFGNGEVNFWYDKWMLGMKLADVVVEPPADLAALSVKQVANNEGGPLDNVRQCSPPVSN